MKNLLLFAVFLLPFIGIAQKNPPKDSLKTPLAVFSEADNRAKKFLPQYAPLSPNASIGQKFGNYQVNLATGIPSIPIPLFTIKNGGLSVPISLNYHAGGFKLNEQASWVGWGFSLDIGASLNRTVQGLKDDSDGGSYLTNPITESRDFCYSSTDFNYGQSVVKNEIDTQPDIFSYKTADKNGKFILGQNGAAPFKIPDYPVQISHSGSPFISSFNLVDDSGVQYVFGNGESQTVTSGAGTQTYVSSWLISQIKSPNSDDAINYTYQDGGSQSLYERQWVSSLIFDSVPSSGGHFTNSTSSTPAYTTVSTTIGQKNPQTITYTNGEAEFIQSNVGERLDLTNSHYLKQINLYNYEEGVKKLSKRIDFSYSYFSGIRLKLDKITLKDANGTAVEEYTFDYWSNTISWNEVTDNEKKDFFGYYNGKPNTHLIPVGSYSGILIDGGAADRSTVDTYMKEGVLKRITFPTKGYSEFDYETNKYNDGTNNVFAGGLRVKSIKSYSGTNSFMKRYEYSSSAGAGIGRLTTNWTPTSASIPTIQHLLYDDQEGNANSFGSANQASFTQSGGAVELNTIDSAPVYYTTVTEYFEDAADSIKNGRNVYTFDFEFDVIVNAPTYYTRVVKPWKRGNLLTKTTYDTTNTVISSLINQYQEHQVNERLAGALVNVPNVYDGFGGGSCATGFDINLPEMAYAKFYYQTGANLVVNSTNQIDNVSSTQSTVYDSRFYVKSTANNKSYTNHQQLQEYIYPNDPSYDTDTEVLEMRSRNILNVPLESIEKENINGTINTLYKQKTVYTRFTGTNARGLSQNVLPKEIWIAPTGGTLEKRVEYTQYDSYGNPIEYKVDGISTALIWGYGNSLLLGQVQNASLSTVNAALSTAGITALAYSTNTLSSSQLSSLATFRSSLPQATLVSWFTYRPHIGLSSSIAPNGLRSSFFYDAYTRLSLTQDHENNKLTEYFYEYGTTPNGHSNKITTKQYRATTTGILLANSEPNFITTHDYFDGLGRPIQQVGEQQSPQGKDIVFSTQTYDKYNRLSKGLTVFPTSNATGAYVSNGTSLAQSFYGDAAPYTTPLYESSPLNRLRSSFGLGSAWQVAGKKMQYFDESAGVDIKYYTVDVSGNITLNGTYPANSLYKKRLIDEQGNASIEITDRQGRLVQKQQQNGTEWLTTYYINDGLGRVSAILQPEAVALNSSISQGSADWLNGVFFYKYDTRGRLIESHVPNGGFTYSVYDQADRMVLSQDAHQATLNRWTFQKYDGLSRNILSGELPSNATRNSLQSQFDSHTTLSETFDSSKPEQLYYSNSSFPFSVDSSRAIEVNYYDSYSAWRKTAFEPSESNYSNSTGLLTGVRKRFTENNQWLTQAFYYDTKNRNTETQQQDILGNVEDIRKSYRFLGGEYSQQRVYKFNFGDGSVYYSSAYGFDFVERKTSNVLFLNLNLSSPAQFNSTVSYNYNEIGQLSTKKIQPNRQYQIADIGQNYINRPPALSEANTQDIANKAVILSPGFSAVAYDSTLNVFDTYLAEIDTTHSNGLTDAMQVVNYGHHIRGQLNCINCHSKQVRIGNKENDLFGMKLDFEGDKRYYDGNISKQTWRNPLTSKNQVYKHFYDGVSRLTKSAYSGGSAGSNYSLDTLRYSPNGNILQLKRHTIDNLSYNYSGNQLLSVSDGGTIDGFKDGNTAGNDYGYWANGSLKFDKNKGIDSILYHSYLRKVSRVKFANGSSVNFYYDGAGTLLKRKLSTGDVWIYKDAILLKNGKIYQITHDEGRVIYDSTAQKWVQEFDYRDHQGNLRLSFRDSLATPINGVYAPPVITQITEQDPTGVALAGLNYSKQNKNNFGFINRETIAEMGWIDLNNRFYMPDLMRFGQTDPITEGQEHLSLYQYGWNNPVRFSDPNGDFPCIPCFVILGGFLLSSQPAMAPSGGANAKKEQAAYRQSYNSMGQDVLSAGFPVAKTERVSAALYSMAKREVKEEIKEQGQKQVEKSRNGALNEAKRDAGIPRSQQPEKDMQTGKQYKKVDMTSEGKKVLKEDGTPITTREYTYTNKDGKKIIIQDHSAGHPQYGGDASKPHINVRPPENTRTGKVEGTKGHYTF
jgi:RHS repeat-associated protein